VCTFAQASPRYRLGCLFLVALLLGLNFSCSRRTTTATSRFYHALSARYNTLYNASVAYDESYTAFLEGVAEDYNALLPLDPIVYAVRGVGKGGDFQRSKVKAEKAIREHSLQRKPARKPGWRRDPRAVAEQAKTEYNPALSSAWLLLGKCYVYEANLPKALATFQEASRIYATEPEVRDVALLWQARCYLIEERVSEALELLQRMERTPNSPVRQTALYHTIAAEYALLCGNYPQAITSLLYLIPSAQPRLQRARLYYLLGELYEGMGATEKARKAYQKSGRTTLKPALEFAARLKENSLNPSHKDAIRTLTKLVKTPSYRAHRSDVYLALGQAHLAMRDSLRAEQSFRACVDSALGSPSSMALANLLLAELSLSRELYPEALEHLRLSLPHLPPSHPRYDELTSLSASLTRLAPLALTLRHQDSLALHASSPEERAKAQAQTAPTLLGMAQILYGELGDSKRAEALYLRIMNDLPKTKERSEAIYRYLLLTLREKQGERAEMLRHRFLSEYPDDPRAKLLAQSDYISGLEARNALAAKLYHEAFTAYRKGQGEEAEARLRQFRELYPDHELRPQALLLGALVRAQGGDNEGFRRQLEQLIRTTPRGDVVELATVMLRKLDGGHRVTGGVLTTPQGLIHPQEQPIRTDSLFTRPHPAEIPELLLIYPIDRLAAHEVLFAITAFDYQYFTQRPLEVTPWESSSLRGFRIRGFQSQGEIARYLQLAGEVGGLLPALPSECLLLPITPKNLTHLTQETLAVYRQWLAESSPTTPTNPSEGLGKTSR